MPRPLSSFPPDWLTIFERALDRPLVFRLESWQEAVRFRWRLAKFRQAGMREAPLSFLRFASLRMSIRKGEPLLRIASRNHIPPEETPHAL